MFEVGNKVKVKQIDTSTHYEEYVGRTGTITQIHTDFVRGPYTCANIAVELGDGFGEVRFYANELELMS